MNEKVTSKNSDCKVPEDPVTDLAAGAPAGSGGIESHVLDLPIRGGGMVDACDGREA